MMARIHVAGLGHRGTVKPGNDDHYCIGQWVEQSALVAVSFDTGAAFFRDYGLLAAVADGMGGYAGGAFASRVALEILQAQFYAERRGGCNREEFTGHIRHCLVQTQGLLAGALRRQQGLEDAGTTIAGVAMMPPDLLVVFHAGDSRVLLGCGGFVRALTVDHTPLGADLAAGRITEQEAAAIPGASRLTRSLGATVDCEVELGSEQSWAAGDWLLAGTDGWHGPGRGLGRASIRQALDREPEVASLVSRLVAASVEADGVDNATLVAIRVEGGGDGGG
ncbi:MAG: serine/threonine-protein phosphatase [bacterium]|nr:serine/threonine-protein phosphatase [bacterium]